ncbi:OmpH family outer membrane protein [Pseudobythopirellula maris]|nr:OmpH family outer membrane protein [Pseudobythopirellula maris]
MLAAAAAFALFAVSFAPQAQAQNPAGANAKKFGIGVVDINYIFKQHAGFRAAMDGMKTNFQSVETELKGEQQKIVQAEKQKQGYNAGTPEYNKLDDEIVQMKAQLQLTVTRRRKALAEQEAAIFYKTYREVDQAIDSYAKHYEIGIVFRFSGDEIDPNNRESILQTINRPVHFQNQIDITPDILAMLNRNSGGAAASNTSVGSRPGATRPR